jgi:hypothetical protein
MKTSPGYLRSSLSRMTVALAVALLSGCGKQDGPPLGTVSGYVRAEGAPVSGALVIFEPEEGRASVGRTDERGWYELRYTSIRKGAEIGRHTVRIEDTEGVSEDGQSLRIPSEYNSKSKLTAEVVKGSNKLDFDVEISKNVKKTPRPTGEG